MPAKNADLYCIKRKQAAFGNIQTSFQSFIKNYEGVYDLTVVHPGVKHKLHTLIHQQQMRQSGRQSWCIIGLNASWSTLKDQCRCVMPVCATSVHAVLV